MKILVDFSNFVATCYYPALQAEESNPALYDAKRVLLTNLDLKLGTLKQDFEKYGVEHYELVFVEDRHSKRKYDLYPEYKGNREKKDFDPRPLAKEWLQQHVAGKFCHSPDNEADDAIASLVAQLNEPVIIVSSDKDLWSLFDPPQVHIYLLVKGTFLQPEDVQDKFELSNPRMIPLHKALWGDSGDNVPNAAPRMQRYLRPLIEMSQGDPEVFWKLTEQQSHTFSDRCKEVLCKGEAQVKINWQLVNLDRNCQIVWENL